MQFTVISSLALALMAPVAHSATVMNNFDYADCQNPGPDRSVPRDTCNYRADSTHAIRLKSLDRGCVWRGYESSNCAGTSRINLSTTGYCQPVIYPNFQYEIRSWKLTCQTVRGWPGRLEQDQIIES